MPPVSNRRTHHENRSPPIRSPAPAASHRGHGRALALMACEAAIADLLARLGALTRVVSLTEGEIRVLAAMPATPARGG